MHWYFNLGKIWRFVYILRLTPNPGSTQFMPRSVMSKCPSIKRNNNFSMMNLFLIIKWYNNFSVLHGELNTVLQWLMRLIFKINEKNRKRTLILSTKALKLKRSNLKKGMCTVERMTSLFYWKGTVDDYIMFYYIIYATQSILKLWLEFKNHMKH